MGGLANAIHTLHRPNSLRYWDLGPKPLVGHWSCLADALIRVYDAAGNVTETRAQRRLQTGCVFHSHYAALPGKGISRDSAFIESSRDGISEVQYVS